jgi:predicted RecB family endonuclease
MEHFSSRSVLEKMMDVLEQYIKIVIQIMQPEEFSSLHECSIFDDADKSKMFITYKDMMILHREMLKSSIKNDDADIITTIIYVHSELKNLKPEIINIVQKMQDSWKITGTNGKIRYFG